MAALTWREILAADGSNDGWETDDGRWVISSMTHLSSGTVEWFYDSCPLLEVVEHVDVNPVTVLGPEQRIVWEDDPDDDRPIAERIAAPRSAMRFEATGELVPQVVKGDDGQPVMVEQRWNEIVRDERPPPSTDLDDLKAYAQAHTDGPEALATVKAEQDARRAVLVAQRRSQQDRGA